MHPGNFTTLVYNQLQFQQPTQSTESTSHRQTGTLLSTCYISSEKIAKKIAIYHIVQAKIT